VNKCDLKTFEKHVDNALKILDERSAYEWEIELGEYKDFIKNP